MLEQTVKKIQLVQRPKQASMLAKEKSAYGGDLLKTRAGRRGARPLSTRETMHLVLRSTKAKGDWSFRKPRNQAHVNRIIDKFSVIYGVRVISMANVGNHLHLQIKLSNRFTYKPFIRAVTAAITMAITRKNRWTRAASTQSKEASKSEKFWDRRPFTRIVDSFKAWLNLKDYIRINQLEGAGYKRGDAAFMLKVEKKFASEISTFNSTS